MSPDSLFVISFIFFLYDYKYSKSFHWQCNSLFIYYNVPSLFIKFVIKIQNMNLTKWINSIRIRQYRYCLTLIDIVVTLLNVSSENTSLNMLSSLLSYIYFRSWFYFLWCSCNVRLFQINFKWTQRWDELTLRVLFIFNIGCSRNISKISKMSF